MESNKTSVLVHCSDGWDRTAQVLWCGVVWCGVVWCGVVWCSVVWCGGVWCGAVCYGVMVMLMMMMMMMMMVSHPAADVTGHANVGAVLQEHQRL